VAWQSQPGDVEDVTITTANINCFRMTETSPVSFMTTTDDPMEKRLDSVGRLLPHVSAKIVNPEPPYEVLPIGQKGELAVAGYNVQKGYWNDPAKEAEVMKKDDQGIVWMHTGDEAEMDGEGYIKVCFSVSVHRKRGGGKRKMEMDKG
jgi:acyl-CoA synthetase (AMP-forming)/AMP-acid ligase II